MKKIFILLSFILISCGDQGVDKGISTEYNNNPNVNEQYEKIILQMDSESTGNYSLPKMKFRLKEGDSAVSVLLIKNNSTSPINVTYIESFGSLGGDISSLSNCPAILLQKRTCFITYTLTAPSVTADSSFTDGSITFNGQSLDIDADILDVKTSTDIINEDLTLSDTSVDLGNIQFGSSFLKAVLVKNNYLGKIDNFTINTDSKGDFDITHNCPSILEARRVCVIYISYDASAATIPESKTGSININSQKTIDFSAEIIEIPSTLDYISLNSTFVFDSFDIENYQEILVSNDSVKYNQTLLTDFGVAGFLPSAVSIDNNCPSELLPNSNCLIKFIFDASRFHNGVSFTKDVTVHGQTFTIEGTGTSPCPAGQKLNTNKSGCIDNLGIFDDADSLYGHAVYQ